MRPREGAPVAFTLEKLFKAYFPMCFHSTQKASKSFDYTHRRQDVKSAPILARKEDFSLLRFF